MAALGACIVLPEALPPRLRRTFRSSLERPRHLVRPQGHQGQICLAHEMTPLAEETY